MDLKFLKKIISECPLNDFTDEGNVEERQLQNTFNLFKSIIPLTMNGCFYSVISEYRTMYESFVIERYLLKHPELLPLYKIHSELIVLYINKKSVYFPQEQEDRYNEILQ